MTRWLDVHPWTSDVLLSALVLALSYLAARLLAVLFARVLSRVAQRTPSTLDDHMVTALKGPLAAAIFLGGAYFAVHRLPLRDPLLGRLDSTLFVIGASIAYHLTRLGWTDVLLLERDRLTSGTTWHAAGLIVTFGSTSETSTEMRKYTRDLYAKLEAETGQSTGFKPCGFIEVASDKDRLEEYRRVSAFNRYCGVDVRSPGKNDRVDLAQLDLRANGFRCAAANQTTGAVDPRGRFHA